MIYILILLPILFGAIAHLYLGYKIYKTRVRIYKKLISLRNINNCITKMSDEKKLDLIFDMVKDMRSEFKSVQKDITDLKVDVKEMQVKQSWINGLYGTIGGSMIALMGLAVYFIKS